MNYHRINKHDVANGEGIRVSLFVAGCPIHCDGCFNSHMWSYGSGEPFTEEQVEEILEACEPDHISGLSILGGEPFAGPNLPETSYLARRFKSRFPDKTLWCWTGYRFDQLIFADLINYTDVLVDGQFENDKKDLRLRWCGSTNQRVIDVKASINQGEVIEKC